MFSFKIEHHSFQPLLNNMRHPVIQLLAKTGFSAFILASAQAASAITITYSSSSATNVPIPDIIANPRPLQLSPSGTAMTVSSRNFIYQSLVGDYAPAGAWTPVGQSTSMPGEQRFDYTFPNATTVNPGPPQVNNWINNLTLAFGSFYLGTTGSCSFCGPLNPVGLILSTNTGTAEFIGESPTSTPGNQNTLTSGIHNIIFGASGITGTLQYTAFTDVTTNPFAQNSGGTIVINVNDPNPPTTTVPGPLPVLGAGAAFGYSRRLRRRILAKANRNQNI
ncbi:MAG: hypothetical protein ACK535_12750 [Cyanobacteriota bacterium]